MKLRSELPSRVSLPLVPHYTEHIEFKDLGLPQGFDDARLQVNVRGLERARRAAGLGHLSIMTRQGGAESVATDVGNFSPSGEATFGVHAHRRHNPLAQGNAIYPDSHYSHFGKPPATILLNRSEMDERIREDSHTRGLLEPHAQAVQLDKGIARGIHKAGLHANANGQKSFMAAGHGIITSLGATSSPTPEAIGVSYLFGHALFAIMSIHQYAGHRHITLREAAKEYRVGLAAGLTLDRYIGLQAITATHRFVTAAK